MFRRAAVVAAFAAFVPAALAHDDGDFEGLTDELLWGTIGELDEASTVDSDEHRQLSANTTTKMPPTTSMKGGGDSTTEMKGGDTTTNMQGTGSTTKPSGGSGGGSMDDDKTTMKPKPPRATIKASVTMKVSKPADFVKDPLVKTAIATSIATIAGVPKDFVTVVLSVVTRRLSSTSRRLEGSVKVDYTITIPADQPTPAPGATAPPPMDISAIESKLSSATPASFTTAVVAEVEKANPGAYTVQVTSVSTPTVEVTEATSSRPPRVNADFATKKAAQFPAACLLASLLLAIGAAPQA